MEVPIASSSLSEKDNKIEILNNETIPKFEDIVDIKNYPNKIINETQNNLQSNSKQKNNKNLRFCVKKNRAYIMFNE